MSEDDLFNNPMVRNALKSMSKEQLEQYKEIGKQMYSSVNFEESKIINELTIDSNEIALYAKEGLKAGLKPSDLSEMEIAALKDTDGEKWYEQYNDNDTEISSEVIEEYSIYDPETGQIVYCKE